VDERMAEKREKYRDNLSRHRFIDPHSSSHSAVLFHFFLAETHPYTEVPYHNQATNEIKYMGWDETESTWYTGH
jgi:hypothetical protein